eukprot:3607120-Prymnesium_polylepis.1
MGTCSVASGQWVTASEAGPIATSVLDTTWLMVAGKISRASVAPFRASWYVASHHAVVEDPKLCSIHQTRRPSYEELYRTWHATLIGDAAHACQRGGQDVRQLGRGVQKEAVAIALGCDCQPIRQPFDELVSNERCGILEESPGN